MAERKALKPLTRSHIKNIKDWSKENNIKLNRAKSKEMTMRSTEKCNLSTQLPPPCTYIERVTTMKVLGVIIRSTEIY